ncbi:Uncharacterised protein [Mycobacteroides abscessus subsp. abscessus]|nr:Uncharacterised protein [Mycobacteroides abscessus subsp. abscessus]
MISATTPSILSPALALSGFTFPAGSIATAKLSISQRNSGLPPWRIIGLIGNPFSSVRAPMRINRCKSLVGALIEANPWPMVSIGAPSVIRLLISCCAFHRS